MISLHCRSKTSFDICIYIPSLGFLPVALGSHPFEHQTGNMHTIYLRSFGQSEESRKGVCKNLCGGSLLYPAIKNLGRFLPEHKRRRERVLIRGRCDFPHDLTLKRVISLRCRSKTSFDICIYTPSLGFLPAALGSHPFLHQTL